MATKEPKQIKQRFLTCLQSKGGAGKTTLADMLIGWYRFAGVPYSAIDTDLQHRTLSSRYPDVPLFDSSGMDEFGAVFQHLPDAPAVLMDCPAQYTDRFLSHADHYDLLHVFEESGIRTTLLMMASDDIDARDSALALVKFFGERVDYVMIENPAKFQSDGFKRTGLCDWLIAHHAPAITIPKMSLSAIDAWERIEEKTQRRLPLADVVNHPDLPLFHKLELSKARDMMLRQFEASAQFFVPDPAAIKQKAGDYKPKTFVRESVFGSLASKR